MANEIINREGAEALIPDEISKEIIQGVAAQSVVLSKFTKLQNMSSKVRTMPVLSMLPVAYFVDGDTGKKQIAKMAWDKKRIIAEEIAVIIPIPESVLNDAADSGYDIWGEVKPRAVEAFGKLIDGAVIFGTGKPSGWRDGLLASILSSGNTVTATNDLFMDIMGEDGVFSKVEESGFEVNGVAAGIRFKSSLRGLRDENKQPIFKKDLQSGTAYSLDGALVTFSKNGTWDNNKVKMIAGDFSQGVYAIRQDITYKLLTEGIIQDPATGEIIYNLAQQDMVALRIVMRLGWELPNPINAERPDEATRLPFAALVPAASPAPANYVLDENIPVFNEQQGREEETV